MVPHATVLEDVWSSALPQLEEARLIASTEGPIRPRIIRVGQLDAELLDKELAQVIQEPINKALSLVNVCPSIILRSYSIAHRQTRQHSERVSSPS